MKLRRRSIAAADLLALDDVARALGVLDEVVDEPVDAARAGVAQDRDLLHRQVRQLRGRPARTASSMSWLM